MSSYNPNVPTGTVNLDRDYVNLQNNFQQLDTTFGVDHYMFSVPIPNGGFHNQVSTPGYVASPPTGLPPVSTATIPKFYGFQDSANIGTIQYSRGWDLANSVAAVPTPLTSMQSSVTALPPIALGAKVNILDFTGLTRCAGEIIAWDMTIPQQAIVNSLFIWDNASIKILTITQDSGVLRVTSTGTVLQIQNVSFSPSLDNVYWTVKFFRIN